jgi:hypothetical protein
VDGRPVATVEPGRLFGWQSWAGFAADAPLPDRPEAGAPRWRVTLQRDGEAMRCVVHAVAEGHYALPFTVELERVNSR